MLHGQYHRARANAALREIGAAADGVDYTSGNARVGPFPPTPPLYEGPQVNDTPSGGRL